MIADNLRISYFNTSGLKSRYESHRYLENVTVRAISLVYYPLILFRLTPISF